MIAIIQLVLTAVLTILYGVFYVDFTSLLAIIQVMGFYLIINIIYIILVMLVFVSVVYLTQKVKKDALWKHRLLMQFSEYIFQSLFRVKPIVKGLENLPKDYNFVLYSNHVEYSDPFYLKQYYNHTPLSFISKEPLFEWPIVKNLLVSIGCIPIGRFADRKSLDAILQAIKSVKSGQPMAIFPEGKRSYSNDPIPFKAGAFKVAQKAKADISLAALYNFHESNLKKFRIKKVPIYISILPLIKYDDYKHMDTVEISKMAYNQVVNELDEYKNTYEVK